MKSIAPFQGSREVRAIRWGGALRRIGCALLLMLPAACDDKGDGSGAPGQGSPRASGPAAAVARRASPPAATQPNAPKPPGYDADRVEPLRPGRVRSGATALLLTSEGPQSVEPRGRAYPEQSLLVRELARQAVLIAGRDGLGLSTRDASLREPLAAPDDAAKPDAAPANDAAPDDGAEPNAAAPANDAAPDDGAKPDGANAVAPDDAPADKAAPPAAASTALPLDVHWYVMPGAEAWFALADHDPLPPPAEAPPRPETSAPRLTVRPWLERSMEVRKTGQESLAPLVEVVEQAEALSRGELVVALESAGFAGEANATDLDGPLAPGISELLDRLDLFAQYQAVREAHADIRARGESPARLGALVRGYANLGQLAQFHWHPSHNALAARSLLYAERMVATAADAASPVALWHRAYARALAGLHADALDDLAEAAKPREGGAGGRPAVDAPGAEAGAGGARAAASAGAATGQEGGGAAARDGGKDVAGLDGGAPQDPPPPFVELLEAYCRYQSGKLGKLALADPRRAPLAMYLCYRTLESSYSISLPLEVGKAALEVDAGSARVIDSMCNRAGVGYLHSLTEAGPQGFATLMRARLKPLAALPEGVRAAGRVNWHSPATQAAVARAMVDAGAPGRDPGEPSWALLGRQVQEVQFAQVYRRTYFMARQWAVDARGYARQVEPLVADHPYRLWISAVAQGVESINPKALADIQVIDYEAGMGAEMAGAVTRARYAVTKQYSVNITEHANRTAFHLETRLSQRPNLHAATTLLEVSPHSPLAIAHLIEHAWDANVAKVKGWEERSDGNPTIIAALAKHHAFGGDPAEAVRLLRRFLDRSSDSWAYFLMADNYLLMNREDQWLATLEEFLEKEDYGLNHAQARVRIARHFMAKGDYRRAEPYVLAANETGAGWAMVAAADLYEGLGDLPRSEQWMREEAERYGRRAGAWYRWRVRTGRGDLAQAEREARREAEVMAQSGDPVSYIEAAIFYLMADEPEEARKLLQQAGDIPWAAIQWAMMYDDNEHGHRQHALKLATLHVGTSRHRDEPELLTVGVMMRDAWADGPRGPFDLDKAERAIAGASPGTRTNIDYFLGRFLDRRGEADEATKYYTRCVKGDRSRASATLAWLELKKRGIDPRKLIAAAPPAPAAGAAE